MRVYTAYFTEPVEWFTYEDKWDSENKRWIENGEEVSHFDDCVEFRTATAAKKFIKEHLDKFDCCDIMQYFSDGSFEPIGKLDLKGNNSAFIANSERNMKGYNY